MPSESTQQHRAEAAKLDPVRVAVLTFSDTRTEAEDKSGALIRELLEANGHEVAHYEVLPDEPFEIRVRLEALADDESIDAILTNGGTGIAPRDGAYEAVDGVLDRHLPGFGEIFRVLSYEEVGAAAMLSRALGGLRGQTLVFAMPGSSNAVGLAMHKLILPELKHLVYEMRR